jgi:GDP-L-fucose synthase
LIIPVSGGIQKEAFFPRVAYIALQADIERRELLRLARYIAPTFDGRFASQGTMYAFGNANRRRHIIAMPPTRTAASDYQCKALTGWCDDKVAELSEMEKKAPILVTGGGGMVGRALRQRLQREGYENVAAPSSRQFDLRSAVAADQLFAGQHFDYVFHLAGRVGGIGAIEASPVEFLYQNALIGMHVIQAARAAKIKKLIFLSSSCAYPRDCPQPMKEKDILTGMLDLTSESYALAKIAAMKLVEYSNQQYGTNFLNLMPCNLYGPGDHFASTRSHVVPALIYKLHSAKQQNLPSVEVWGTGTSRREFLYIDDLVDAMLHFMLTVDAAEVGTFVNIGLGQDVSIRELVHAIKEMVRYSGEVVFNPSMPDGMPRKLMDVTRATQLGWRAKIGILEGLRRAYDWFCANVTLEVGVR